MGLIEGPLSTSEILFAESARRLNAAEMIFAREGHAGIEALTLHAYRSIELALQGYLDRIRYQTKRDATIDELVGIVLAEYPTSTFVAETVLLLQSTLDDLLIGSDQWAEVPKRSREILLATEYAVRALHSGEFGVG